MDPGLHGMTSVWKKRSSSVWQGRAVCEKSRDLPVFMVSSLSCSKCDPWNVLCAALRTNNVLDICHVLSVVFKVLKKLF